MKRLCALLILTVFLLCGCAAPGQPFKEPVTFYYLLEQYQYGKDSLVLAGEEREAAGHRDDLSYLMALYLIGPSQDGLVSPLPKGTRIHFVKKAGGQITMSLSDTTNAMSDIQFSSACACITLTLLDLTDAQSVTCQSGSRSITLTRDTLILSDNSHMEEPQ